MLTTVIIAGLLIAANVAERIAFADDYGPVDRPQTDMGQADGGLPSLPSGNDMGQADTGR